jgi:hypothetical protein
VIALAGRGTVLSRDPQEVAARADWAQALGQGQESEQQMAAAAAEAAAMEPEQRVPASRDHLARSYPARRSLRPEYFGRISQGCRY